MLETASFSADGTVQFGEHHVGEDLLVAETALCAKASNHSASLCASHILSIQGAVDQVQQLLMIFADSNVQGSPIDAQYELVVALAKTTQK